MFSDSTSFEGVFTRSVTLHAETSGRKQWKHGCESSILILAKTIKNVTENDIFRIFLLFVISEVGVRIRLPASYLPQHSIL